MASASEGDATGRNGDAIVLTGATSGIGRRAALELADDGATVAAVGRDEDRGRTLEDAAAETPGDVTFYRADLAVQDSVRELADRLRADLDGIDVLAHNAGISRSSRTESPDGVELTLAVNHLAPYLLTHELLDELRAAAPSRVVVTASEVHRGADLDFDDLQFEDGYDSMDAYGRSKLANVAFTFELAERLPEGITANCFHPGFVPETNLFRNLPIWMRLLLRGAAVLPVIGTDVDTAAERLLHVVTDPAFDEQSGTYVVDGAASEPAEPARDPATRERLWEVSADLVGVDPDWP